MAVETKTPAASTKTSSFYRSTIGQKIVMAVTGLILLGYLVLHMLGNLKIFFGAENFNGYAHWLRTLGEPALGYGWVVWGLRIVLLLAVIGHIWAAASLTIRDHRARPEKYEARRKRGYAASTMRWGGVILALFIVYHILDMTAGVANPAGTDSEPFDRVTQDFKIWYVFLFYTLAMVALCLHIAHGLWSAATTLGVNGATTKTYRTFAVVVSVVIAGGFLLIPISVATGLVK